MTPSPTLERVAKLAHALKVEPWLLLHPEPELAQRAHAVVLAAKMRPDVVHTLHEPAAAYRLPKRRQLPRKGRPCSRGKR